MKFNQGTANEVAKWILFVLLVIILGGGFLVGGVWMLLDGMLIGMLLVLYAILWLYIMVVAFHSMAAVTLSDEGVAIRVFVSTKHYSWDEIVQAGVLWSTRQYRHYNDLVLLPKTAVVCDYHIKMFAFKNQLKLIHLPYTLETVSYVLSHYGPLDFDYSRGQGIFTD